MLRHITPLSVNRPLPTITLSIIVNTASIERLNATFHEHLALLAWRGRALA
jgi:hypothetical protein